MKSITNDLLKDSICNNNIEFLKKNAEKFSINHRFIEEDNDTLLSYSISDADSDAFLYFLDNGADTNLTNGLNENILHSAIYSRKLDRVKLVLNSKNINDKADEGISPLLLAISLEEEKISNYLIDSGACVDCPDLENNYPIHLASFFGLKKVVLKLLDKKVDLNIKTKKGNLPLALAVNNEHTEIVNILYKEIYGAKSPAD